MPRYRYLRSLRLEEFASGTTRPPEVASFRKIDHSAVSAPLRNLLRVNLQMPEATPLAFATAALGRAVCPEIDRSQGEQESKKGKKTK